MPERPISLVQKPKRSLFYFTMQPLFIDADEENSKYEQM